MPENAEQHKWATSPVLVQRVSRTYINQYIDGLDILTTFEALLGTR